MSSAELGHLPTECCLYHPTCPVADPAGNLAASFTLSQGEFCMAEMSVCVIAL